MWALRAALMAGLLLVLAPVAAFAQGAPSSPGGRVAAAQTAADWAAPRTVYIPATGHFINGYFLDLWRTSGGQGAFGNPITPEITLPNGHVIQYYDYARFEYWPEGDENGNLVRLGDIGTDLRPVGIRRGMPVGPVADTSAKRATTGQPTTKTGGDESAAVQATKALQAWVPLSAKQVGPDTDNRIFVPDTGHTLRAGFLGFWDANGQASYLGNPLTEEFIVGGVTYQIFERGELSWSPDNDVAMVPVGQILAKRAGLDQAAENQGDVPVYSEDLFVPPPPPPPPPPAPLPADQQPDPNAEKWIEVNLSEQYMIAWQGDVSIIESYVSTGRPGFETPTGTFNILTKLESQTMTGVIGGEYYNVPDVPHVMYFTNLGHALHGTYWHNMFGMPMSHGCVNLPMDVADFLYGWAPVGTRVEIHY